jgi:hypothetical protein
MITRAFAFWSVLLLSGYSVFAAPPALPCKSPEELLKAVQYALTYQDTNYFWKLCYWKEVPVADEPLHKRIGLIHFKQKDDVTKSYSGFRLLPAPPDVNKPRPRRKNGPLVAPNLPITGLIGYKTKGTATAIIGEPSRYSAVGDVAYGKAPDGTYWLPLSAPLSTGQKESSSAP